MQSGQKLLLSFVFLVFSFEAFSQSRSTIDSLLNELKKYDALKVELRQPVNAADTIKAKLLYSIMREYNSIDVTKLKEYAQQLLTLSIQIKYHKGIGNAYNGMGRYYLTTTHSDSALISFN